MSLMAIILWALYGLSPLRRLEESARHLLSTMLRVLSDPRWPRWLEQNRKDPSGYPNFERMLNELNAGIDLIVYQKARALLGLRPASWKRPRQLPLEPTRSRSFAEFWARLEACAERLADLDRLARRRAERLKRLLNRADPLGLEPAHALFTASTIKMTARRSCLPLLQRNWGRWIARSCAQDGGGLSTRTGQRVRAPP